MPLNTPILCLVRAPESSHPAHVALLSAEERTRHQAFATEPLRAAFACAHALLRSLLSACLGQAPGAIDLSSQSLTHASATTGPMRASLRHPGTAG